MSFAPTILSLPILINLLLQITMLTAIALMALVLVRKGAAWRFSIAFTALIAIVFLAIVSIGLQRAERNAIVLPVDWMNTPSIEVSTTAPQSVKQGDAEFTLEVPDRQDLGAVDIEDATLNFNSGQVKINWWRLMIALWVGGTLIGFTGLFIAAIRLYKLRHTATSLPPRRRKLLDRVLLEINEVPGNLLIQESIGLQSPVQVGFFKPRILLPNNFLARCSADQLEAVLIHELAHWQRRDNLGNLLQKIIVVVFWFHPFVRVLDRIADRCREEICDNYVLARKDPVSYGETLLKLNHFLDVNHEQKPNTLAASMIDKDWKLEERINDLLNQGRDNRMQLSRITQLSTRLGLISLVVLLASSVMVPSSNIAQAQSVQSSNDQNADEPVQRRSPPQARTAETLRPEVFESISTIQELLSPEVDGDEADPEQAKQLLDLLYDGYFESSNSFEQSTILSFYTNYYLMQSDFVSALQIFEQILTIEDLRDDAELRALRSLGQLYAVEERWGDSINSFESWLQLSGENDEVTFKGLAYAHYQLEEWALARDYWLQYLDMVEVEDLNRSDYAYLTGLHYQLGDFESARSVIQEMILRFNQQTDWDNLRAIHQRLDEDATLAELETDTAIALVSGTDQPEIAFATVVPTDADYLPLVAVAPMYPTRAAQRGIEGWVLLEFTVDEQGRVVTDSIEIVDSEPAEIFHRSSQRAAEKFLFQPRTISGVPTQVPGVQYLFRFALEDDDA